MDVAMIEIAVVVGAPVVEHAVEDDKEGDNTPIIQSAEVLDFLMMISSTRS